MTEITDAEKAFMERPDRHPGETNVDKIIRDKGTEASSAQALVWKRTRGGENTITVRTATNPRFAMDALVPDRSNEDEQKRFLSELSPNEQEREKRNAHARANIVNETRGR